MNPLPTARLFRTGAGSDLVLTRTFRAPAEDVWEGHAAPGRTIKVQMVFEDQAPWGELYIEECEPPRRLAVSMADEAGTWRMELLLSEANGATELRLVHHLETEDGIGEVGPGWEFYLDMLAAAREGSPKPDFDDYYPAMRPYFTGLSASN
jgi:uncharacterized protein YndB with AHSA1/START domain